jgi:nucleoside-diphosphate-sugar epimerase
MPDRVEVTGIRSGTRDFIEIPTVAEAYLAALEKERAGYASRGDAVSELEVRREIARLAAEHTVPVGDINKCANPDCKLMHPHAGPAVLRERVSNGTEQRKRGGSRSGA